MPVPVPVLPVPLPVLPPDPVPLDPLPLDPLPPEPVPLPLPTGAAPPVADETGMVVVVVGVVGVVVVVGVVGVGVVVVAPGAGALVALAGGVGVLVATTVNVAVGADVPLCGAWALTAKALADDAGAPPLETCDAPLAWLPVPEPTGAGDPAAAAPDGPWVVPAGAPPDGGTFGPAECAERMDWPAGPAPIVSPATTESAAAAAAADAMNGLWTKYGFAAATSDTAGAGDFGTGCPNARDVKTSSKVA